MKPTIITIRNENSDFQYLETLQNNRTKRNRAGEFIIEGVRSINQALEHGWKFTGLIYSREQRLSDWAEEVIERSAAPRHYHLPAHLMEKLSQKEDTSEVLALLAIPPDDLQRLHLGQNPLVVVLDRPMNPGNIGTIIRTCDALGAGGMVITGHAADLYEPETVRATTGSFFSLPCVRLPSHVEVMKWVDSLKEQIDGLQVVGTSAKASDPVMEHDLKLPTILLIGNETHGLSQNYKFYSDALLAIPMAGSATSMNMAVAAGILLYEAARQRRNKK